MDLDIAPEQTAFRTEVRAFLRSALPEALRSKAHDGRKVEKVQHVASQRILAARGWLAPGWLRAHGGASWGPMVRLICNEELHLAGAPLANLPGIDLLGPPLIEFGTEAQKARYLPRILSSDDWWCQGFSEPGASSASRSAETAALHSIRSASVADGSSTAVIRGTRYSALAPEARTIGPQRS